MAAEPNQTVGDLRCKAIITDNKTTSATDAALADPKWQDFEFDSGRALDVTAAEDAPKRIEKALAKQIAIEIRSAREVTTADFNAMIGDNRDAKITFIYKFITIYSCAQIGEKRQ